VSFLTIKQYLCRECYYTRLLVWKYIKLHKNIERNCISYNINILLWIYDYYRKLSLGSFFKELGKWRFCFNFWPWLNFYGLPYYMFPGNANCRAVYLGGGVPPIYITKILRLRLLSIFTWPRKWNFWYNCWPWINFFGLMDSLLTYFQETPTADHKPMYVPRGEGVHKLHYTHFAIKALIDF
jgi:hypothetical protein